MKCNGKPLAEIKIQMASFDAMHEWIKTSNSFGFAFPFLAVHLIRLDLAEKEVVSLNFWSQLWFISHSLSIFRRCTAFNRTETNESTSTSSTKLMYLKMKTWKNVFAVSAWLKFMYLYDAIDADWKVYCSLNRIDSIKYCSEHWWIPITGGMLKLNGDTDYYSHATANWRVHF